MRLRHVTLTLLTVAARGAAPLALADPLDPDPSFGGDGIVTFDRYGMGSGRTANAVGRSTYVGGLSFGGGSLDWYASVAEVRSTWPPRSS